MKPIHIKGVGLGLRFTHFDNILEETPQIPWFEVIVDDFLSDGPHHHKLLNVRQNYPIAFHSVGLNLGGTDPFDTTYLATFKSLYEKYDPFVISDHLCWSSHGGLYHHDLLPIPKTSAAIDSVCERIDRVQEYFGRTIAIENITQYIDYQNEEYSEVEFIKAVTSKTGCDLLLDISNIIINHKNQKRDWLGYFSEFPLDKVVQVHLSGGSWDEGILIDSHSQEVGGDDIDLLLELKREGLKVPVMIERDAQVPEFAVLNRERALIEEKLNGI